MAVAKQAKGRAQKAKVVQGLNDRYSHFLTGLVDGRRNHHEGIVYVNKIGALGPQKLPDMPSRVFVPNDVLGQREPPKTCHLFYLVVAALIGNNLMSMTFKQLTLLSEGDILSTGLLVAIVDDEQFHTVVTPLYNGDQVSQPERFT
jgi:hypothetical protein